MTINLYLKRCIIFSLIFFLSAPIFIYSAERDGFFARRKVKKAEAMENGDFWISPLIVPLYTPELGFYVAGIAQMSFKTDKSDSLIQRSTLPVSGGYGVRGNLDILARLNSYWNEDKMRIEAIFRTKNMTDHYWGVGYDDGFDIAKSESTTEYQRLWVWFNPQVKFRVMDNLYVGANIDISYTDVSKQNKRMLNDADYLATRDLKFNTGIGAIIEYDSRDIPVNAYDGMYLSAKTTYFSQTIGGDSDYGVFIVDYRQYKKIVGETGVLAWSIRSENATGDVPWSELPKLGTPFDLRGYFWGRYRENSMFMGLAEFRQMIPWKGKPSKIGYVLWAGAGTIGKSIDRYDCFLPNYGLGMRFEVQPRMNVRIDCGFGKESMGVYFNILEAF